MYTSHIDAHICANRCKQYIHTHFFDLPSTVESPTPLCDGYWSAKKNAQAPPSLAKRRTKCDPVRSDSS